MQQIDFLYVAPRFHTNQFDIVKYLVSVGKSVEFHVIEKEFSEDYTFISPTVIKASFLYKLVGKLFLIDKTQNRKILLPCFPWVLSYLLREDQE